MKTADELCQAFKQATTNEEIVSLGQELKNNIHCYTKHELVAIATAAVGITDDTVLEDEQDGWCEDLRRA